MPTQLTLYNGALVELGESTIASTSEDSKARRVLDSIYDDVIQECLEAATWNHATREVQLDADTGITPEYGFTEVFAKPTDWIRTTRISADETFSVPLLEYSDGTDVLSANVTPIYLDYISDDSGYGMDLSLWPRAFTRYVEVALADRACMAITQSESRKDKLEKYTLPKAKRNAMSKDYLNEPTKFLPMGSWNRARGGGGGGDRGSRGSLTG